MGLTFNTSRNLELDKLSKESLCQSQSGRPIFLTFFVEKSNVWWGEKNPRVITSHFQVNKYSLQIRDLKS